MRAIPLLFAAASGVYSLAAQTPPPPSMQPLVVHATANGVEVPVQLGDLACVLELAPCSLRAPGFTVFVDDGRTLHAVTPPPPVTYRGTVRGSAGTVAASLRGGALTAVVHAGDATWGIEPRGDAHAVYRNDAVAHTTLQCGCASHGAPPASNASTSGSTSAVANVHEAQLALDADFEFFQRHGSSVAATVHAIEAIMNPVDEVYRRDVQIRYRITTIVVRTQPLYTTPGVTGRLADFTAHWNQNHAAIVRDVAHLFTGVFDPSLYGLANLPSVCNVPIGYCVSAAYQPLHVDNVVLVAHELGHTWDAAHCISFPCHIMCPLLGCSQNVEFGAQEQAQIVAYRSAQTCLDVIAAGAFAPYGSGCAGSAGVPAIGSIGSPLIGQTFTVTLANARPVAAALLAIGGSDASWNGITLPLPLAPIGAPGCTLLAAADLTLAFATTAAGTAQWPLVIPPVPELFGITLFTQWAIVDPGSNTLGLVLSPGGALTIG